MIMKKFILIVLAVAGFAAQSYAQKLGYINTEKILSQLPEYVAAQEALDALSAQYKEKVEAEFRVVEQMYNKYMAVKNSLTAAQQSQQEEAIIAREKSAKELRNTYFGQDGHLQKKSGELMMPIRAKVSEAVDKIAKNENFMIIFDLAIMQGVVYDNPQYDLSNRVLEIINSK